MTVQAFNPSDLSQSAANWAVSQRIVGNFAPHAQLVPNLTLALDPGNLLNGTTLTEVNAQSVGPFAPPASGFRIDRVVVDRGTGAAAIVTGTANSLTPPAIPAGKLPVARVMLLPTSDAVTNDAVVDERALADVDSRPTNPIIAVATLNGVNQSAAPNVYTKVNFSNVVINSHQGFDPSTQQFKPSIPGVYSIFCQLGIECSSGKSIGCVIRKNGNPLATYFNDTSVTGSAFANTSTVTALNGIDDYIEFYGFSNNSAAVNIIGTSHFSFFTASLLSV
ncbi:C1q-like domain-containing protein [Azospirillum melinis]